MENIRTGIYLRVCAVESGRDFIGIMAYSVALKSGGVKRVFREDAVMWCDFVHEKSNPRHSRSSRSGSLVQLRQTQTSCGFALKNIYERFKIEVDVM